MIAPVENTALTPARNVDYKTQLKEAGKLTLGSDNASPLRHDQTTKSTAALKGLLWTDRPACMSYLH